LALVFASFVITSSIMLDPFCGARAGVLGPLHAGYPALQGGVVMPDVIQPNVAYRIFRAAGESSWDKLFNQASEFASSLDRRQIINISHSSDGGSGTVVVWYVRNLT